MWLLASIFWEMLQIASNTEWGASVWWNLIISLIISTYLCLLVPRWANRCPRCRPAASSCSSSSSWRDRPEASAGTAPLIFWCLVERAGDGLTVQGQYGGKVKLNLLDTLNQNKSKDEQKETPHSEKGLTEYLTDLRHRLEDHAGEADGHFDGFHVGELQQQGFVLGCVAQFSVSLCETLRGKFTH